jgi:hypothetical protein
MNDTIKKLAMGFKVATENLDSIPDCDKILRSKQYLIVDSCARILAYAVLNAIESNEA